jgi:hypothetical protein
MVLATVAPTLGQLRRAAAAAMAAARRAAMQLVRVLWSLLTAVGLLRLHMGVGLRSLRLHRAGDHRVADGIQDHA